MFTFITLYTLFLSKLDYCLTIWSPHFVQYISTVEKVDHKSLHILACKLGLQRGNYPYPDIYLLLNLYHLEKRWTYLGLIFFYKLLNGNNILHWSPTQYTSQSKISNNGRYQIVIFCRELLFKFYFLYTTIWLARLANRTDLIFFKCNLLSSKLDWERCAYITFYSAILLTFCYL